MAPASIDNLCQNPAFDPTAVRVTSASLAAAVDGGWTPIGIRPDGVTFALVRAGAIGTQHLLRRADRAADARGGDRTAAGT